MGVPPLATASTRGVLLGIAAYAIWGLFPLYWKQLRHVPALEVLAHRIVWSCVLLLVVVTWRRSRGARPAAYTGRLVALYGVAAVLIGVNWFLYVWGVSAGQVLQTSLGYFLTPLVSVVLGVVVFKEALRPLQWFAVLVAAAGMAYMAVAVGGLPWVSVGLAASFGSYSAVKKRAPLGAFEGLLLETILLWLPAAFYLGLLARQDRGVFVAAGSAATDVLLVAGGLVTIVPMLLFASSLRLIPLSTVGILQFLSPSLQFVLGVWLYHEPFGRAQLVGFVAVWVAVACFALDSAWANRGRPKA